MGMHGCHVPARFVVIKVIWKFEMTKEFDYAASLALALLGRYENDSSARTKSEIVMFKHLQLATLPAISIRSLTTVSTGTKNTAISRTRSAIRASFLRIWRLHSKPASSPATSRLWSRQPRRAPKAKSPQSAFEPKRQVAKTQ